MFEIGRELRRFFAPARPRDGLSAGDPALLELLDLRLLQAEARAADVAAGRIGVPDRDQRLVEASATHRELARRTGDVAALRKAAACAEQAAGIRRPGGRGDRLIPALCAQAEAAMLGAELFGDAGLDAAADFLAERASPSSRAEAIRARLAARRILSRGGAEEAREAARAFDAPLSRLEPAAGKRANVRAWAQLAADRAEFLTGCGARLRSAGLIEAALADLERAAPHVDGAYLPLTLARLRELQGLALVALGDLSGEAAALLRAVDALEAAIDLAGPDHSPLDWARRQHGLGLALAALGEIGSSPAGLDRALQAYGRALAIMGGLGGLAWRAVAVQDRAACLVRRAELVGDGYALDEAEAVLRGELTAVQPRVDPLAWAVIQLNLARIYLARAEARGGDRGEGARAGEALAAALEVFSERGLRSLAVAADAQLERLRSGRARAG